MTDHDAIQELLAGHALDALSGEDALETSRLLDEHVPSCAECQEALAAFDATVAELALAVQPLELPETLLPRLHGEMQRSHRRRRGFGTPGRAIAVAAAVAAIVGGLLLARPGGPAVATLAGAEASQAFATMDQPDVTTTDLGAATEVMVPSEPALYIVGRNVPLPPEGWIYRLWFVDGERARHVGDFVPREDGMVALRIEVEPDDVGEVAVTVEPEGSDASEPGRPAWNGQSQA